MPIVSAQETAELVSLLSVSDQTFAELSKRFKEAWPSSKEYFRLLCAVFLFLQEGAFKQPVQRFSALHLLHSLTRFQPPAKNPFAPFLIQAVQDPARPFQERLFIQLLLTEDKPPEGTIFEAAVGIEQIPSRPIPAAEEFWHILQDRAAERAKEEERLTERATEEGASTDAVEAMLMAKVQEVVAPPFMRPKPRMLPIQPGELRWLHPQLPHLLRWDHTMGQDQTSLAGLQQLLKQAQKGPLLPGQQQQVLGELEADRKLVLQLNLTPAALPELVEHNPAIAIEVLLRLIELGQGHAFLPPLVTMEMSLHSMEVINRLSTAVELPSEFVHAYISNCIQSCQAAQEDKYMQTRRVRLVCVFLQSLIRNRIINVQDLFYDVQAFCIEFSRVREAAALFRLLKTLENGDKPGAEPANDVASSSNSH